MNKEEIVRLDDESCKIVINDISGGGGPWGTDIFSLLY